MIKYIYHNFDSWLCTFIKGAYNDIDKALLDANHCLSIYEIAKGKTTDGEAKRKERVKMLKEIILELQTLSVL